MKEFLSQKQSYESNKLPPRTRASEAKKMMIDADATPCFVSSLTHLCLVFFDLIALRAVLYSIVPS